MVETSRGKGVSLSPRRPQALNMWQANHDASRIYQKCLPLQTQTYIYECKTFYPQFDSPGTAFRNLPGDHAVKSFLEC